MPATMTVDDVLPVSKLARKMSKLQFTERMNDRLHALLDRKSEGTITPPERDELDYMMELNEVMSMFKARGMLFLQALPGKPRKSRSASNGKYAD